MMKRIVYILLMMMPVVSVAQRQYPAIGNANGLDTSNFSGGVKVTRGIVVNDTFPAKGGNYITFKRNNITVTQVDTNGTVIAPKLQAGSSTAVATNDALYVTGKGTFTDSLKLYKSVNFMSTGFGIQFHDANTAGQVASILIGRNPGTYPNINRQYIGIGNSNLNHINSSSQIMVGNGNNTSAGGGYHFIIGAFNTISSTEEGITVIGESNTVSYPTSSTSRGEFCIGGNNTVSHAYSSVMGNYQRTTANNQLIIADGNENTPNGGYRYIYFGAGPRSSLLTKVGPPTTINGSGAGLDTADAPGGLLRIAAGLSTGNATSPDLLFATGTPGASGTTLQSLTDRWYIKGGTGYFSNTSSATSYIDITGSTGYDQLRLRTSYTPTGTADANGNTGDIAWDSGYLYIKTAAGWKRAAWSTF